LKKNCNYKNQNNTYKNIFVDKIYKLISYINFHLDLLVI